MNGHAKCEVMTLQSKHVIRNALQAYACLTGMVAVGSDYGPLASDAATALLSALQQRPAAVAAAARRRQQGKAAGGGGGSAQLCFRRAEPWDRDGSMPAGSGRSSGSAASVASEAPALAGGPGSTPPAEAGALKAAASAGGTGRALVVDPLSPPLAAAGGALAVKTPPPPPAAAGRALVVDLLVMELCDLGTLSGAVRRGAFHRVLGPSAVAVNLAGMLEVCGGGGRAACNVCGQPLSRLGPLHSATCNH